MAVKSSNCKVLEDPETQSPQSRPIAGHAGAARRRKTGTGQRWYSVFCSQSLVIFCTRQTVDSTKSLLDQHIHRNRPVRSAWERNARIFRHLWRYMIAVRRDIARSHILMWFFSFLLAMSCLLQNRKHIGLYSSNELMAKRNKIHWDLIFFVRMSGAIYMRRRAISYRSVLRPLSHFFSHLVGTDVEIGIWVGNRRPWHVSVWFIRDYATSFTAQLSPCESEPSCWHAKTGCMRLLVGLPLQNTWDWIRIPSQSAMTELKL